MNFERIIKLFTHALKKKLSSDKKIEHEDIEVVSSILKKVRHVKVDTAERVYQFMTSIRFYFKLLNDFSAQFENGSHSHVRTVREALDLFVIVVDKAQIVSKIIKKYCKLVDIIVDTEPKNANLREYFRVCSYFLTKCVEESVCFEVLSAIKSFSCSNLSEIMKTTSDVELQALIIEVFLKLIKNNRNIKISGIFDQIMSLVDQAETQMNIYQNLRMILHDFNAKSNIFSMNCSNVLVNSKRVREFSVGAEQSDEIWLDIDLVDKKISFFCDPQFANSFTNFNYYISSEWEVLSFFAKDIHDISFFYNNTLEQLHISILCDFVGGLNRMLLEIVASRYSDKFSNFIHDVIPKVFSSDFDAGILKIPNMENESSDDAICSPIFNHFEAHKKKIKISANSTDCGTNKSSIKIASLDTLRILDNVDRKGNVKISALQIQANRETNESLFSDNSDETMSDLKERCSNNKTRKNRVLQSNHFEVESKHNTTENSSIQVISDSSDGDDKGNQLIKKSKRKRSFDYELEGKHGNSTRKLSTIVDDENNNSKENNKNGLKEKLRNRIVQSDENYVSSKCASNCSFTTSIHFVRSPAKEEKISTLMDEPEVKTTIKKTDLDVEEQMLEKPAIYQNLASPLAKVNVWLKNAYFENAMPESERTVGSNPQTDDVFNFDSVSERANDDVLMPEILEDHILDDNDDMFPKSTLLELETEEDTLILRDTDHHLVNPNRNQGEKSAKDVSNDVKITIEQLNEDRADENEANLAKHKKDDDLINLEVRQDKKKIKSDEIKNTLNKTDENNDDSVLRNMEMIFEEKTETTEKPANTLEKSTDSKLKRKLFNPNDLSYLNDSITEDYIRSRDGTLDEEVNSHKGKSKKPAPKTIKRKSNFKKRLNVKKKKETKMTKYDVISSLIKKRKSDITVGKRTVRQLYNGAVDRFRQHKKETKKKSPNGKKTNKNAFCLSSSSSSMEPLSAALRKTKKARSSNEMNLDDITPKSDTASEGQKINVISNILIKPPMGTGHYGCCETAFRSMTKSYLNFISDIEMCKPDLLGDDDCRKIVNILQPHHK